MDISYFVNESQLEKLDPALVRILKEQGKYDKFESHIRNYTSPVTEEEVRDLAVWMIMGHIFYSNPWGFRHYDLTAMDLIEARRVKQFENKLVKVAYRYDEGDETDSHRLETLITNVFRFAYESEHGIAFLNVLLTRAKYF